MRTLQKMYNFDLVKKFYAEHYSAATYLQPTKDNGITYYGLFENGKAEPIGMCGVEYRYGNLATIWQMVTNKNLRRTGVGQEMYSLLEDEFRKNHIIK